MEFLLFGLVNCGQFCDRGIVIHPFGGIGGNKREPAPLGKVTGHFAYGVPTVERDRPQPFSAIVIDTTFGKGDR